MHQRFEDAAKWSQVFDDPKRDAWQKPAEVVRALGLAPHAIVADLGAGTGYFAVRLARAVPRGRVYAADIERDMVRFLNLRAAKENLKNMQSVLAAADRSNLPAPVDLVLLVDTYHHIGKRADYFGAMKESLLPGGRVAIIDFTPESPVGPPVRHRIAQGAVIEEMGRAGYTLVQQHKFLPYQYFLVFAPR